MHRFGRAFIPAVMVLVAAVAHAETPSTSGSPAALLERGRYLVRIAGCNDCHTPRYAESGGAVPEAEWLTGDSLGWRGPWGTTYAANLRLYMGALSESEWLAAARGLRSRPPMPWFALRDMTDDDLRAIYHFIRSLGPRGGAAPAYVPPQQEPQTPYVQFPLPSK